MVLTFLGLSTLMLGACGKTPQPENSEHKHNYSIAWTSNATHHWHNCAGCDEVSAKAKHTVDEYGKCSVCGYYTGVTKSLNTNLCSDLTLKANEKFLMRIPVGPESEYGIMALFNDDVAVETKCEVYAFVNKTPVLLKTATDYDILLLHFPANADDRYVYLRLFYTGTLSTFQPESFKISSLVHGCDNGNWYYGVYDPELDDGDSCDFESPDKHINGKYYVAFAPSDPDDCCYEITVDCQDGGSYSLRVFQDQGGNLVTVEQNGLGRYLPNGANELIIEIETSTPGSQVDVIVAPYAR